MEPPSYEEAGLHPPALGTAAFPPPPSYATSLHSPPTPPPTYGEAVQPDPFPVLTVPTVVTSHTGITIHPITQIGVTPSVGVRQTQPAVVVTQPRPHHVSVSHLEDFPSLVVCSHCHHSVTTKVTYQPGKAAWCMCFLLAVMGLFCGFCLIPLMVRSLQDAHHSCPRCGNHLHTYIR
ncbi:lipopolysaccharide-induced tumor necrosis factor-alpha factor homolog [Plectropomus leopardus]|uniref:lipopolysaccharide-induced tumor necrosis factor-alpha factor homolog n=1 Tax=Plectropomus leopardus TaxID=160734 RepID=UPI001C4A8014|nr:lipopolysaccharide-induced tumor necrosis factor-alpha factor homolog [Plectropomus leopardus]XP_042340226.1 lipopolysaccharide-induced tumor necrosis factor-alpha factor homolog [Plectropomus leopardus]XP_042340227.1 lipopolysaccharide-induced tumor necrosis factor-alpha factor homolog [Plectropomus leopardus]XP_042340228.1 lipopolysaccharide-induced tumor necrosis factor-alpha factor homolog [Plectropomus leopardus]XP_042340229.1 lipopolysaccharide-induced tumor necrosis factor-alpha facto